MKNKLFSIFTALAMVLGILVAPFTSAHAADEAGSTDVVIHKLKFNLDENYTKDQFLKDWPKGGGSDNYDGTALTGDDFKNYFGEKAEELDGVTFTYWEITKEQYDDFNKDKPATAEAVKTALGENAPDGTTTGKTADKNGVKVTLENNKYYWFIENTESVRDGEKLYNAAAAVPFGLALPMYKADGSKFGTGKDALHLYPKNILKAPKIDKNFDSEKNGEVDGVTKDELLNNANDDKDVDIKPGDTTYQREKGQITRKVGDSVPYKVETVIPQGSAYKKLTWNDKMSDGLTYQKDLVITYGTETLTKDTDYFITETDRGFTLVLKEAGLNKIETAAKDKDVTITLKYTAKVNKDAIVDKDQLNDIALDYSNKPGNDNEPEELTPVNKEITVKKSWDITGDDEITEADKGVTAYFTLQKKNAEGKWEDIETVEKTVPQTKEPAQQDAFTHTFSNLDENGTYRVVESVKGYEAKYKKYNEQTGELEITNHKDTDNPDSLNPSEPKVVNGGKKFVKTNADGSERLIGAGFKIENKIKGNSDNGKFLKINNDTDAASKAYATAQEAYKNAINAVNKALANGEISADNKANIDGVEYDTKTAAEAKIAELKATRDEAFKKAKLNYEWVAEDQATEFYTNEKGQFEVTGLAYGDYRAKETQKPAGYALPTNGGDFTFEVKKGSYTTEDVDIKYEKDDTDDSAQKIVNNKVTIPQTGGIGSLIFVVAGLAIMAGAYAAYRKSQARA